MDWIRNDSTDPAFNLALEETLLARVSPAEPDIAMLWQNRPAVIIGRFQNARSEVNGDVARKHGIAVARRITGGGAVFHDAGTLNYTFIHYIGERGRIPSFREAGLPVAQALQSLGLPVSFSGRNDLLLEGRKVAGVAHCRRGDSYLHHGCILVDADLHRLEGVLAVDPEKLASKGVASVRSRVTNLADWLAQRKPELPRLTVDAVRAAILANTSGLLREVDAEERAEAVRLCKEKFATWDWIYGASPPYVERRKRRFAWGGLEARFAVQNGIILSCAISGDFLGDEHASTLLEKTLKGLPYKADSMRSALLSLPLESLFAGCNAQELVGFLVPE